MKTINRCSLCNSIINVLSHHIDQNRDNNIKENLIDLCANCHRKIHVLYDKDKNFQELLKNYNIFKNQLTSKIRATIYPVNRKSILVRINYNLYKKIQEIAIEKHCSLSMASALLADRIDSSH